MKLVKAIYRKFRKFFSKHGYFAFGSLAISVYYFHKIFQKKIPQVKLSYFLIGLSNNLITEIYRIGSNIKFRGPTDDWYQTDASILKDNALKDLLRENSKIIYNNGLNIFFNFNRQNLLIYICSGLLIFQTFKLFGNNPEIRQNLQTNNKEITFKDVCGMNEAKNELLNCVEFMKNPKRFHNIGARLKKGILIYGKPGTGKTFLAKV